MSTNLFDENNYALSDVDGNQVFVKGTTVPTDTASGYVTGCYFVKTDGSAGASVYINEGSATSCNFNAISGAGSDLTTGILTQTGQIVGYSGQTGTSYTVLTTDCVIQSTGSANTLTVKLPTATAGRMYRMINSRSTVGFDIAGDTGETVAGATTLSLGAGSSITLVGDGTNYIAVN